MCYVSCRKDAGCSSEADCVTVWIRVHNRLAPNVVIRKTLSCYLVLRLILGSRVNFRSVMLTVAVSAVGMEMERRMFCCSYVLMFCCPSLAMQQYNRVFYSNS